MGEGLQRGGTTIRGSGRHSRTGRNFEAAKQNFLRASGLYRLARWPACNSPGKKVAYAKSKETFLAAAKYFDIPVERVEMPFAGRPGEGNAVIGYFRRPAVPGKLPLVLGWGGLDYYKEDAADLFAPFLRQRCCYADHRHSGTADAPVLASPDAERMWDAVFAWIKAVPTLMPVVSSAGG